MIIALVGQPNSGKSTIFNAVAGYKTVTANFPGATVEMTKTVVTRPGAQFGLVDVPGIYSLFAPSPEDQHAAGALLALEPDVVIHVVDSSLLSRSLELTLQLLELGRPLVVCLNMIDEAQRKGVVIDTPRLEQELGVPVVPTIATRGEGIPRLFRAAVEAAERRRTGRVVPMSRDVESVVARLEWRLPPGATASVGLPPRLLALELLESGQRLEQRLGGDDPGLADELRRLRRELADSHGRPPDVVISSERHALSMNLFERVAQVRARRGESAQDRADRYLMHPVWGYLVLAAVLLGFFYAVFGLGRFVETPLVALFGRLDAGLRSGLPPASLSLILLSGVTEGLAGGVAIVLPYLVPFLAGIAVLEDLGYVPRVAFLMDGLMHRIGLHGKAVIPFVLGYGCSVPAVMAARMMESPRDRYVTAFLASFIPCAARTTIVFALVGYFVGPLPALGFYLLNLLVVAAAGRLMLRVRPEVSPGLILEIPPYRLPSARVILGKLWFRLREFIVVAWPILIVGSIVLSLLEHFDLAGALNAALAPITSVLLGLPPDVGVSLVFGILRKELTIVMLVQALGTTDFAAVLTTGQMCVYTAFALFYVPCLATLATLRAVVGTRATLIVALLTTGTAAAVALVFRLAFAILADPVECTP
jgi:ferrous iron transport protein B